LQISNDLHMILDSKNRVFSASSLP
jgi:hypothetical protein